MSRPQTGLACWRLSHPGHRPGWLNYIDESGVVIPGDIAYKLVDASELHPNSWNPNRMDDFMRSKLTYGIKKDGFVVPILVRPHPDGDGWEIVDGEHRWRAAVEELGMKKLPIVNLGDIDDAHAKQITIKANTLRGEFDSIELGRVIKDLVDAEGLTEVTESLPYTGERISGLLDLLSTDVDLGLGDTGGDDDASSDDDGPDPKSEFRSFDPDEMKFDHKCPRCGFQFNDTNSQRQAKPGQID